MRRKALAMSAPQTLEHATTMIDQYAMLSGEVAAIEAERAIKRAEIDADCDARIAVRAAGMKELFQALERWWAVAGDDVAKGKRSAVIGAVEIGKRKTPAALRMKGTAKANIAALLRAGMSRFLKVKHSLDKEAIKRALSLPYANGDDGQLLANAGFTVGTKDEFYIDPLAERDGGVETVS